jgi:hypothetical protein
MDRLETAHEALVVQVSGLSTTIARVEQNQTHSEELEKLRWDALNLSLNQMDARVQRQTERLTAFIERIDKILSGEIITARSSEMLAEYKEWHDSVEERFGEANTLAVQVKLLGRLAMLLVGGSIITTTVAVYVAMTGA